MPEPLDIAFLRTVFETSLDGIIVFEVASGQIIDVSPAATALYGYSHDEFVMLKIADLTADPEATAEALRSAAQWIPLRYQRRKDGTLFPAEIAASQFMHRGREIRVGFVRDITRRLKTETDLQASETKYASAFRTSPDAVNINRASDGLFLEINEGFTQLTGYTQLDVAGKTSEDVSLWANASDRERLVEELGRTGSVQNLEASFRLKDGSIRYGLMSARVVKIGRVDCILSVTRDITDRLLAEQALQASEAKFATAFRTSPDAVNLTTVAEGRYLDVNDGFCALTGYEPDEVVGRTVAELSIWADNSDRDKLVDAIRSTGKIDQLIAGFRRKDGSILQGSMSARLIDIAGVPCILSVTRDISEQIAGARELQRSYERLTRMVRDVSEAMGRIVETRDPYTQGHQERVSELSLLLAGELGLDDEHCGVVEMAALVHDVGKLAVPAEILNRPGQLSDIEFSLIKIHSEKGFEILRDIDFGAPIAQIVLQHHERMDGSGYPAGLSGDDILFEARILSVADVVEAMASYRPYRPAVGLEPALAELAKNAQKYDERVVSACLALRDRGELAFLEQPAH